MAAAVARSMTLGGQNIHLFQNNCMYQPTSTIIQQTSNSGSHNYNHGKRQIAPAPQSSASTTNVLGNSNNNINFKQQQNNKRIAFQQVTYSGHQPTSVARRNARERNRVKQVNNGFANLRQHIPQDIIDTLPKAGRGASKKLSKVDTLRMAVEYIRRLVDLLDDANESQSTSARSSFGSSSSYYIENSIHHSIPTCSEASVSPTPSYTSETSNCNNIYAPTPQLYLHDTYENYETLSAKSSDEELLDVITNWQDENNFLRQS